VCIVLPTCCEWIGTICAASNATGLFPSKRQFPQDGEETVNRTANAETVPQIASRHLGGRPRIEIDWQTFDRLCEVQCTLAEIAAHFGVSEDTIERAVKREHGVSFADYFGEKRKAGFISLRRRQYELAMAGNATMLIFLGKQYLGQADKQHVTTSPISFEMERIAEPRDENGNVLALPREDDAER
jgi:AraC-like DNA-binding protein